MTIMTDRAEATPPGPTVQTSATEAKLSAQPATSTIRPNLAEQIEAVRATLPATSFACRYGNAFCVHGANQHDPCSTGWLVCHLPGEKRSVTVAELAIEHYEENKPPVLVFCPDGHDAVEISVAEARAAVAAVLDHLPRMLTMIDQYDALVGGA